LTALTSILSMPWAASVAVGVRASVVAIALGRRFLWSDTIRLGDRVRPCEALRD
jgi:hypothetical protein